MKYDSYEDYSCFIMGASIAASRVFWTGEGSTNKGPVNIVEGISKDGKVASLSFKVGDKGAV